MDTASQVLVATVLTVVIGFGARDLCRREPGISRGSCRPVNDVLQTLPQLVYLIPLIYLMPVSIVPGVIAGVLYAFPVVARSSRTASATSRRTRWKPRSRSGRRGAR